MGLRGGDVRREHRHRALDARRRFRQCVADHPFHVWGFGLAAPHIATGGSAAAFGIDVPAWRALHRDGFGEFWQHKPATTSSSGKTGPAFACCISASVMVPTIPATCSTTDSAAGATAGTWHHLAFTNEAGTGEQEIFVDGVSLGVGGVGNGATSVATQSLLIGTSENGGAFTGLVDEIKIFDTRLSRPRSSRQWPFPSPARLRSSWAWSLYSRLSAVGAADCNGMPVVRLRSLPRRSPGVAAMRTSDNPLGKVDGLQGTRIRWGHCGHVSDL